MQRRCRNRLLPAGQRCSARKADASADEDFLLRGGCIPVLRPAFSHPPLFLIQRGPAPSFHALLRPAPLTLLAAMRSQRLT